MKKFLKSPIVKTILWSLKKIFIYSLVALGYITVLVGLGYLLSLITDFVGSIILVTILICSIGILIFAITVSVFEKYKEFKKEEKMEED